KLYCEKMSLQPGDILLASVPKNVPLTLGLKASLSKTFTNLLHDKGVRVLIKNEDIGMDKLADLLTAEDVHRILERIDQRKLAEPVNPIQN
ncbi:MAG: hypothetical protein KGL39_31375, partial [Patescibacteria group bacterium]|nr:hypothetical protein [Patescibacteria group bacterium]